MTPPTPKRSISKRVKSGLSKQKQVIERSRREILERGTRFKKPLGLARHRVIKLTAGILGALLAIFIVAVVISIYAFKSDHAVVYRVARIIPFPVARVNGNFVAYADYLFEVRYRKNIYENPTGPADASQQPVDFDSPTAQPLLHEIQQSSLTEAKFKAIVKQLAKEAGVSVSAQELDQAVDEIIQRQGGRQKFEAAIEQFYGWNLNDFRREYHMQLLEQKLQLKLLPDISGEQRQRAQELVNQARAGANFATLAKQNSQDPGSKENGGDLGFVAADTPFVEEFKAVALKLEPGQVSDIVASRFGFHIIKATAKRNDEVRVSHILIRYSQDMESLISEELAQARVKDYIKLPPAPQT